MKNVQLNVNEMKELLDVANGKEQGDLLIKNVRLVDVYTEEIYPADILIKNGRVVAVNPNATLEALNEFDGQGRYALPGFVDPHFHVDSTQATPAALAEAIVPHGTTTLCAEFLDITHFATIYGKDPVETYLAYAKDYDTLPYRLLALAPGKMCPVSVTKKLLDWPDNFGLGEMLSHNILLQNEEYLGLIERCQKEHKLITGHVINMVWDFPEDDWNKPPTGFHQMRDDEINQFPIVGYSHDHEIYDYAGIERVLRRGIRPMVRTMEGISDRVMPGIVNDDVPLDHICVCMDDLFLQDIKRNGFVNRVVRDCVRFGMDPIKAIKIGTLNNATSIGLERHIGSITPGRFADVLLVDNLEDFNPTHVFKEGKLVGIGGSLVEKPRIDYSSLKWAFESKLQAIDPAKLAYVVDWGKVQNAKAAVDVYNVNTRTYEPYELPVKDGVVQPDPARDIVRGALVNRSDEAEVIHLFFKGFGLKEGAIAINFCQNKYRVIVAGIHLEPMLEAVKEVDRYLGAMTCVDENARVVHTLEMDIAACASSLSGKEVVDKSNEMIGLIESWGVELQNAFMMLWVTGFLYLWD